LKLSRFEKTLLNAMVGTRDIGTACNEMVRKGSELEGRGVTKEDLISKGYLTKRGKWPEVKDCYGALVNIRKKVKDSQAFLGTIYSYIGKNAELRNHLIPREPVDRMPKDPRI